MTQADDPIAYANRKFALARNLVWAAGVLLALNAGLTYWLSQRFVTFDRPVVIEMRSDSSTESFFLSTQGSPRPINVVIAQGQWEEWTIRKAEN